MSSKIAAAIAWRNLGAVDLWKCDYDSAIVRYKKSLEMWLEMSSEDKRHQPQVISTITSLGIALRKVGDNLGALRCWRRALELLQLKEDDELRAGVLVSLGSLHSDQRDYDKAVVLFEESLELYTRINNRRESANVLLNLGLSYQRQGKYDVARGFFEQSIAKAKLVDAKDVIVADLEGLGAMKYEEKDYDSSLWFLNEAAVLASQTGDRVRVGEIEWCTGRVYFARGELSNANSHAGAASEIAQKLRIPILTYLSMTLRGKIQRAYREWNSAAESFGSAIEAIEGMREEVAGGEREQQLFFEDKMAPYQEMVDLLAEQGDAWRALQYAEMAKGRVLFEALRNGQRMVTSELTPDEAEKEHKLYVAMTFLNAQLRALRLRDAIDEKRASDLADRLNSARQAYEVFQISLHAAHPRLNVQRGQLDPFTKKGAAEAFSNRNMSILSYVVTENRTWLFCLTNPTGEADVPHLTVHSIPVKAEDVARLVTTYQEFLAKNHPGYHEAGRHLYNLLVQPVERFLGDTGTICIIPDGTLWDLPFQALENSHRRFLLEQHPIFYAPSIQVLREISHKSQNSWPGRDGAKSFYAVGNPAFGGEALKEAEVERGSQFAPLPETEREVTVSARIYGSEASKIRIGKAALENMIKAEMSDYRVLHFATHGFFNDKNPLYSYLLLTPEPDTNEDGLLEAWELMKLNLKAELAVLSACDTARGRVGLGEGIIGLTWAFFVAGVPTTVASQWQVPSEHTSRLMVAFHKARAGYSIKPVSDAEAWRRAALTMIRNPHFRKKPYYWAAFVVIGNGAHRSTRARARSNGSISLQSSRGSAARRAKSHSLTRS